MDLADARLVSAEEIGRHRTRLLRFARLRLQNPAHAEDAVQDALLAAIESAARFRGQAAVGTWLTGILRHKIVDSVRRLAHEPHEPLDEEATACAHLGPERSLSVRQSLREAERRLAELPPLAARVLLMRDILGLSTAEACGELAISANYCAVLLHRARRRLRDEFAAGEAGAAA